MSEYWKSTPKFYCKYCKMYATDTPLSRKNHDASLKHQGNLKRFLRDLHRANEREKSASGSAKREVARLNALTGVASTSTASSSSAGTTPRPPPPSRPIGVLSEAERKRQMNELESLGVALPEDYRAEMAMIGEWKAMEEPADAGGERSKKMTEKEKVQEEIRKDLKRKFDAELEEKKWKAMDEDEKEIRGFTIQTKAYPGPEEERGGLEMLLKGKGRLGFKNEGGEVGEDVKITIKSKELSPGLEINPGENEDGGVEVKREEGANEVVFKKRKAKNIRRK